MKGSGIAAVLHPSQLVQLDLLQQLEPGRQTERCTMRMLKATKRMNQIPWRTTMMNLIILERACTPSYDEGRAVWKALRHACACL